MLLRPRRCVRLIPPVSYIWAKLRSTDSDRSRCSALPRLAWVTRRRLASTRSLSSTLAVPVPFASIRFRDVASYARLMKINKDFAAVVALVQYRFFDATLIDQLRISLSFLQRCMHRRGIAQIRRLEA